MTTAPLEASVPIKVQFYDCDPMGIVWHGNYVKYFEVARCKLLDTLNYNYIQMAESNYAWPIVDMRVKYIKPLTFNQDVIVKAILAEHENRLKINFEITDAATGERMTTGFTIQFAVDMKTKTTCFMSPDALLSKIPS